MYIKEEEKAGRTPDFSRFQEWIEELPTSEIEEEIQARRKLNVSAIQHTCVTVNGRLFRTVVSERKLNFKNSGAVSKSTDVDEEGTIISSQQHFCNVLMFLKYRPYADSKECYLYVGEFYENYLSRNIVFGCPVIKMDRSGRDGSYVFNVDSRVGFIESILPYAVSYYEELGWTSAEKNGTRAQNFLKETDRLVIISDGLDGSFYSPEEDI